MALTHLAMLWWLAAAAAPLVIHLLSRRRYREVSWAAMEYLLAAMARRSRRLRFEHWLLLAIRTAVIIAVVIAVAGPYVERLGGTAVAGNPIHRVIVLDGSYSMAYKPGERSRFDLAKGLIRDLVARSSQGDAFSLVLMSQPARTIVGTPAFVSDDVRDALRTLKSNASGTAEADWIAGQDDFLIEVRDLKLPQGGGDLSGALDRVDEILSRAKREFPRITGTEVYFLTDLGSTKWEPATRARQKVRQQLIRLSESARLAIADLGQTNCENLAVMSLRATQGGQSVYTVAAPIDVAAEVRNFGSLAHVVQIELLADGRRVQERSLNIAAGSQQSVGFAYRFTAPGDHSLEVRLVENSSDGLEVDNHRWVVVPVKESISALVVNGEGASQNSRYLVDALNPYRDSATSAAVQVEQVPDGSLLELDLHRFDCIFLSDVAQFTAGEAHNLASFVRGGGGLVFFLGDRVDAALYNEQLGGGRRGWPRLLPTLLVGQSDAGTYTFNPLDYSDPLVHEFAGNPRAGLLTTIVNRYVRLKKPTSPARVALAFSPSGDPAIVVAPISGEADESTDKSASQVAPSALQNSLIGGRSILVAVPVSFTPLDPITKQPWSNWPLRASFQPMMQNLLLGAIEPQGTDRNVLVGEPLQSAMSTAANSGALVLESPDGHKEQIRVAARADASRWTYSDTWQSGIYRSAVPGGSDARLFAVNIDPNESALKKIDVSALPEQLTVVSAHETTPEQPSAALGVRTGQARQFLYLALALLISETVIAWWFGHRNA
jgi:hypothetical protein